MMINLRYTIARNITVKFKLITMSVQQFNVVPTTKLPHSVFDLSHDVTLSCNMGQLVPIFCQEVLPSDNWRVSSEVFLRFAPMFAPILHRVDAYVHFFFVAYKDIWDDFEDFMTGGVSGNETPVLPYVNLRFNDTAGFNFVRQVMGPGSLMDYLGIPVLQLSKLTADDHHQDIKFNALPFRAYQFIYNEYYRDQNLTEEVPFSRASGAVATGDAVNHLLRLRRRAWEKDYFTSALPWTQRGEAVNMPVNTLGNVVLDNPNNNPILLSSVNGILPTIGGGYPYVANKSDSLLDGTLGIAGQNSDRTIDLTTFQPVYIDPNGTLSASLEVGTIDQFRQAIALQRYLEGNARMGSRYSEQLRGRWHVRPSDSSMHRPVYLGGGRAPVVISETFQQTGTSTTALGDMGGNAVSLGKTNQFTHFFNEHGIIMGLLSIRPKTKYMQGMPRMFMRQTKFDFYTPEFANLGEQPIMHNEIYWQIGNTYGLDPAQGESPFGYIPRWSEYRYIPSSVHGDMLTTLDFWHLGRKFANAPLLNTSFIEVGDNTRIFADTGRVIDGEVRSYNHHIWVEVFNHIKAKRPLPKFSVPSLI